MGLNYRSCDIIVFMSEIYDTDKELTHDDYIGFGLKRFAQLMNCDDIHDYYKNHVDSDNADLTYDEGDSNRITLDGFDSKPDFKYEDDNRMWIGEAKANIDDVNAKNKHNDMNHLESQCRDYLAYLMKSSKIDKRLIISCPFETSSVVRQHVNAALDACPHDGIVVEYVYEFIGQVINSPSGLNRNPVNQVAGHGQEQVFNRMEHYDIMYIDVDSLKYDESNTRFFGNRANILSQSGCEEILLSESYAKYASQKAKTDNLIRKREFKQYGAINRPLKVNHVSADDSLIVIDGNSRLANARDILTHCKSAEGYRILECHVFHDLPEIDSDYLKEHEQHQAISQHGKEQIALKMYEYHKQGFNDDDIAVIFSSQTYKKEMIPIFIKSVEACIRAGFTYQEIGNGTCYGTAYDVISNYRNKKLTKTKEEIADYVLKHPEFNMDNAKLLYNLMKAVNAGVNQNKALNNFINGEYSTPDELNDALETAKNGDKDDYKNCKAMFMQHFIPGVNAINNISIKGYSVQELIAKHYDEDGLEFILSELEKAQDIISGTIRDYQAAQTKLQIHNEQINPSLFTDMDD